MTVNELREKLSKLDEKAKVVVHWEHGDLFFEIVDISASKGTPKTIDGKPAGFVFASTGTVEWAFIDVSET